MTCSTPSISLTINPSYLTVEQVMKSVEREVSEFNLLHNNSSSSGSQIIVHKLSYSGASLSMILNTKSHLRLSNMKFRAFGIDPKQQIGIDLELKWSASQLLNERSNCLVRVVSYQCRHGDLKSKAFYPLSRLVKVTITNLFSNLRLSSMYDPEQCLTRNNLQDLLYLVVETLASADRLCTVSAKPIDQGFRPRMRNCVSYFNTAITSGFGENLINWYVLNEPHLVEYLLFGASGGEDVQAATFCLSPNFSILNPNRTLTPYSSTNFSTLHKAIAAIPSILNLQKLCKRGELKKELDKINPMSFSVLNWIMLTNPVYLNPVTVYKGLGKFVQQYLLLCSPKSVEKQFQKSKSESKLTKGVYAIVRLFDIALVPHLTGPFLSSEVGYIQCGYNVNVTKWLQSMSSHKKDKRVYALVIEKAKPELLEFYLSDNNNRMLLQPRVLLVSRSYSYLKNLKLEETGRNNHYED